MKKQLPITIAIMIFALTFSSCKRTYMCACTHLGGTSVQQVEIHKKNIKDAKADCHDRDEMMGNNYNCELYYKKF